MKKSIYRIIIIATVCILLVVSAFIGTDMLKSRQMIMEQAQNSLTYMCENCTDEFSAIFDNADIIVNNMTSIASELISVSSSNELEKLKSISYDIADNSKYPISIYFIFNPEFFDTDIWYVKGMDGKVSDMSLSEADMEQWLQQWSDDKSEYIEFYHDAIKAENMWYETIYDPDIKWDVVTRTKTIYDEKNNVIGIAAADVYLGDISEKLVEINDKTGGDAVVTNSENKLVAGNMDAIKHADSSKYINAVSEIDGRWIVTLTQPVSEATAAVRTTILITFFLGIIVILALAVIIILVYRKHAKPMIREFEEKDILIINQSRQAQLGEMVGNITHQLKQPLNGVNMALSNLQEDYSDQLHEADREEFANRIYRMKKRIGGMAETVNDFTEFLRPQKERTQFSVKEEIINIIELMKESMHIDMINVDIQGDDFIVTGQKNEFSQCVFNIIDNARDATKDECEKEIKIKLAHNDNEGYIKISNRGDKIDESLLQHIFDLYFTTKENEGGVGIGLYLTKSIIEKHFNGTIKCNNEENGVSFEIKLPLYTESTFLQEGKEHING